MVLFGGIATGCANRWSDFDRIEPPTGFEAVRETAAWCESFDPAWWPAIERAYGAYDARNEAIVRDAWGPFADEMARLRSQNKRLGGEEAMRHRRESLAIDARLAASEREFVGVLHGALPAGAAVFLSLLESRMAFVRACGRWTDGVSRLAGPLEALAPVGAIVADDRLAVAAGDAYLRLAAVATSAAETRTGAYIDYLDEANRVGDEIAAREIALRDPSLDSAARAETERALGALRSQHDAAGRTLEERRYRAIDETLRLELRAEGRGVAAVVADEARHTRLVDRLDGVLLVGAPSRRLIEAAGEIGRRALERREPRDPTLEAQFATIVADALEARARLSVELDAPSVATRRRAFEAMGSLLDPVRVFFEKHDPSALEVGLAGLIAVAEGERSADDALDRRGRPDEAEAETDPDMGLPDVGLPDEDDDALLVSRRPEIRLLVGLPLDTAVLRRLESDLGLPDGAATPGVQTPFATAVLDARAALVDETARELERLAALGGAWQELGAHPDPRGRLRDALRDARAIVARIEAADRRANERVLAVAADLAGVPADDPRLVLAARRLEMRRLVPERAVDPGAEPVLGLGRLAAIDPMDVLDACGLDEAGRAIAESVVVDAGERLVEAARRARESMLANLEELLLGMVDGYAAKADGSLMPVWRGRASGVETAEVRVAIADELGAIAGPEVRRAMLETLARRAVPGLLPVRTRAFGSLARFAAGAGLDGDARAASEPARLAVGAILAAADAERTEVLREALLWRGGFAPAEAIEGEESWRRSARGAPEAWRRHRRLADIDARATTRCETLLAAFPGFEVPSDLATALASFPRPPLVPMSPYLE